GARRLGDESFFSAPQLKRDPLGGHACRCKSCSSSPLLPGSSGSPSGVSRPGTPMHGASSRSAPSYQRRLRKGPVKRSPAPISLHVSCPWGGAVHGQRLGEAPV